MRLFFITFLFLLNLICLSQSKVDSVYSSKSLVPRLGLNIQKGYSLELGLSLNQFYIRIPREEYLSVLPYFYSSFYFSSELKLRNPNEFIMGPKVGWEFSGIGETSGAYFGAELIDYTNLNRHSPVFMLKVGVPLFWINIAYGFSVFFNEYFKNEIGKHRLSICYTINRKADKKCDEMRNSYFKK